MVTGKTSTSAEQLKAGSDVLRKLGISSHYEVSLSNSDYFQSEPSKEILEEKKFKDVETMKEQILIPLNKDFAEDVYVLSISATYIRLRCIYQGCKFQHWFKFKERNGKHHSIEYFRNINWNHTISSHLSKVMAKQDVL